MEMVMGAPAGGLEAAGRVPGNRGMWVGILCELTEFALMFLAYAWFKQVHPADFHHGPAMLNTASGVWNTVVMLTSGYFAVRALLAIRRNDAAAARNRIPVLMKLLPNLLVEVRNIAHATQAPCLNLRVKTRKID